MLNGLTDLSFVELDKFLFFLLLKLLLKPNIILFIQILLKSILVYLLLGLLNTIFDGHFDVEWEIALLDAEIFEETLYLFLFRQQVFEFAAAIGVLYVGLLSLLSAHAGFEIMRHFQPRNRQVELWEGRLFGFFLVRL